MSSPEVTAAEALCVLLQREGVTTVFGHPGGAILPLYDALHRLGAPRHVLVRHEQSAAHAADGWARATGVPGVCLATSGPGATNLVTGLATAMMDGVPLVAITGQVPTSVLGTDAFQETDILGVTLPVTKHGFQVTDAADLPAVVAAAFRLARSGRPGPVLIDLPKDIQNAPLALPDLVRQPAPPADTPDAALLDRAAAWLAAAERPVLLVGRGVVSAAVTGDLLALAERNDLPVTTTLLALDAFPADHPLALGMPGMHGSERANHAIQSADLVIGLGARFDDRVTGAVHRFAPHARLMHFDVRPLAPGRTVRCDLAVVGDLRTTLPALVARTPGARRAAWWDRLDGWNRTAEPHCATGDVTGTAPLRGRQAARAVAAMVAATGATVVTDVGQHQMLMAQELGRAAPGSHLSSGGLGTMGYALPAAIGAALAVPERAVWCVVGDGGFQMSLPELATVVQEQLPLRIVVMNNGVLGMVRQWQELFYDCRHSASTISGPDLTLLARAYGMAARRAETADAMTEAMEWAVHHPGPLLLELRISAEDHVYPLVPTGAALDEMVHAPVAEVAA